MYFTWLLILYGGELKVNGEHFTLGSLHFCSSRLAPVHFYMFYYEMGGSCITGADGDKVQWGLK